MDQLKQCIESCAEEVMTDSHGHDSYVVRSPGGNTSIVSSFHLTEEKKVQLCKREINAPAVN